jgi:hypothetical protein
LVTVSPRLAKRVTEETGGRKNVLNQGISSTLSIGKPSTCANENKGKPDPHVDDTVAHLLGSDGAYAFNRHGIMRTFGIVR